MEPTVSLIAPDGSVADVPVSSVDAAIKKGAEHAFELEAPDGSHAFVPESSLKDAVSRGAKPLGVIPNIDASAPQPIPSSIPGRGVPGLLQGKQYPGVNFTPMPTEPAQVPPTQAAPQPSMLERVGSLVPQAATGPLSWVQQHVNEPLDRMAAKGAEIAGRMTEPIMPISPEERARLASKGVEVYQPPAWAKGVERGIAETAGGTIADVRNWPFLASSAARPMLQRLISGGFSVMMGKNAVDSAQTLYDKWDKLTPEKRSELITKGGLSALMTAGALKHAVTGPGESGLPASEDVATPSAPPALPWLNRRPQPRVEEGLAEGVRPAVTPSAEPAEVGATPPVDRPPAESPPGPGAMNASTVETAGSDIAQLTDWMRGKQISPKPGVGEQLTRAGQELKAGVGAASDAATNIWKQAAAKTADLWDKYRNPPQWTDFKQALGQFSGDLQVSDLDLQRFSKTIKEAVPGKLRREAITNYVQAGGDRKLLEQRAAQSDPTYRPGYEAAANLSPDEVTLANNVKNYFDAKLQEAQDVGMLEHGVENYVRQTWAHDPTNQTAQNLLAAAQASALNPDPSFLKNRVFSSYFEGEQQGHAPKTKDIGALLANYDQSFNKAIASRAFVKALHEGKASDGRPLVEVSGSGKAIAEPNEPTAAYLIKPKTKPNDAWDFQPVDHPALREWKWAQKDESGAPIFVQGDMLVHPEFAQKLRNILHTERNPFTEPGALQKGMRFFSEFKQSMLSFSAFHQVTVATHALEHKVNPFRVPEIDLTNPLQHELVNHGLMVSDFHGTQEFAEGLSAGHGIGGRIPVVGKYMRAYQDYLFRSYIPRLKMSMAQDAFARNLKRYGNKLDRDQILELTSNQANAAFGHLNYRMLGRNPGSQSVARMLMLAPDFLEARAKFLGQALKPFGREQQAALIRGAASILGMKAALGAILNEKQDWDLDHLFFVKVHGRDYALRTIQGDLFHLINSPRSFVSTRLNPAFTAPVLEAVTGRDRFGRPRTAKQQLGDYAKGAVPIPLQGKVDSSERAPVDSALQAIGVQSRKYRSPAATLAHKLVIEGGSFPESEKAQAPAMKHYRRTIDAGKFDAAKVRVDVQAGRLTEQDAKTLTTEAKIPQFAREFKRLTLEKALDVWHEADDEERKQLRPILQGKAKSLENRVPADRKVLEQKLRDALSEKQAPEGKIPAMFRKFWQAGAAAASR